MRTTRERRKSSPSFWRSCRTKLTKEVYRFSPIWHISSVKITRALNDAVPFSNNRHQQCLFVTGTVGLLPPLQFRILASSRANAFCNHRRAEAKIPEKGRDCLTPTDRRRYLRFPRSQRVKEREAPENVEARLVTSTGFLGHTLQYGKRVAILDLGVGSRGRLGRATGAEAGTARQSPICLTRRQPSRTRINPRPVIKGPRYLQQAL